MTKAHLFYQTCSVPFFMSQQHKALLPFINYFEEQQSDMAYSIIHPVSELGQSYDELKRELVEPQVQGLNTRFRELELEVSAVDIHGSLTYEKLETKLIEMLGSIKEVASLTLINGEPFSDYRQEQLCWALYTDWKSNPQVKIASYQPKTSYKSESFYEVSKLMPSIYLNNMFIMYALIEKLSEVNEDFVVNNVWDDPLQHKLDYIKPERT